MLRYGAYGEAVNYLNEAIKLNPKAKFAYNDRGLAEMALGQLDAAIADFDKAIAIYPKYQFAYYNRGLAKRKKGRLDAAIADFTLAIGIEDVVLDSALGGGFARELMVSPTFPAKIYNSRGEVRAAKGDFDGAIEDYRMAIKIDPENRTAYSVNISAAEKGKGNLAAAIEVTSGLIKENPKDVSAYFNRGSAEKDKGNLAGAIEDMTTAIKLDANFGPAYQVRGLAKSALGDTEGAIVDFASTYCVMGAAQLKKGDMAEAIRNYTSAVKLYPEFLSAHQAGGKVPHLGADLAGETSVFAKAYVERGVAERDYGDFNVARGDFSRAARLEPKLARAYEGRADIERMRGDLAHAAEDYNRAIALDPGAPLAFLGRCQLERMNGDWTAAIADCDHVLSMDSSHPVPGDPSYRYLGWEPDGEYQLEYDMFPGFEAKLQRAKAEYGAGDAEDGVDECSAVMDDFQGYGPPVKLRGVGNYLLGNWRSAKLDFEKAVDLDPKMNMAGRHAPEAFVTFDYAQIYLWLARMHRGEGAVANKELGAYVQGRKNVGADEWPGLLSSFLIGKASEEDVRKAATEGVSAQLRGRECQADFYAGIKRMFAGDAGGASADFRKSLETGAKGFFEYQFAAEELHGLARN